MSHTVDFFKTSAQISLLISWNIFEYQAVAAVLNSSAFLQKDHLFCKCSINCMELVARLTSKFGSLQAVQTHASTQWEQIVGCS